MIRQKDEKLSIKKEIFLLLIFYAVFSVIMNTYCVSVSENFVEAYSVLPTYESYANDLKGVSNTPLHQTPPQEISKLPIQNFSDSNHKYFIILKKIKKEKEKYPNIFIVNSKYYNNSTNKLITKNTEHIIDDITKLRLWAFVPLEQCSVLCVFKVFI